MRIGLKYWLPALAWAALISFLSTEGFSSDHTKPIIVGFLQRLLPWLSAAGLELVHVLIRKSAHVAEYSVFSLLLFRSLRGRRRGWRFDWALSAIVIAGVYGALDETHQIFVPGRGASPWDALLDTAAAAAAQLCLWLAVRRRAGDPAEVLGAADRTERVRG